MAGWLATLLTGCLAGCLAGWMAVPASIIWLLRNLALPAGLNWLLAGYTPEKCEFVLHQIILSSIGQLIKAIPRDWWNVQDTEQYLTQESLDLGKSCPS